MLRPEAKEQAMSFKTRFETLQREFSERLSVQTFGTVDDHCESESLGMGYRY